MAEDKRTRKRVSVTKSAYAKNDLKSCIGELEDVSASGALVRFLEPLKAGDPKFAEGEGIDILIKQMTGLSGWVVRASDTEVAVEFAHDKEGEERLIAEIMKAQI